MIFFILAGGYAQLDAIINEVTYILRLIDSSTVRVRPSVCQFRVHKTPSGEIKLYICDFTDAYIDAEGRSGMSSFYVGLSCLLYGLTDEHGVILPEKYSCVMEQKIKPIFYGSDMETADYKRTVELFMAA